MNKIHKFLSLSLCLIFAMGVLNMPVGAQTAAEATSNVTDLTLEGTNCNINLELSSDNQFHYNYNADIFDLRVEDSGSIKNIYASKKENAGNSWEFVTIQIPNIAYNRAAFNLDKTGINIPALNANIDIIGKGASVKANIPLNFNKTLNYSNTDGSGSVILQTGLSNFKFTLDATDSAVGLPKSWPKFDRSKTYTYQVDNATGIIKVNLNHCSFKVVYK